MKWTCQECEEDMLLANKARHIQRKHPEGYQPQSNKGSSMCPVCSKVMHKGHVKRHMLAIHNAAEEINVGQMKKQLVETHCSEKQFSSQSLSLPTYQGLAFIVLDKLWAIKDYVEERDVASSMHIFLKEIDFKDLYSRDFLQSLQCYSYIKIVETRKEMNHKGRKRLVSIKHIAKGRNYIKLLSEIQSNRVYFSFWQRCHQMNLRTSSMRFYISQFESVELESDKDSRVIESQNEESIRSEIYEEESISSNESCFVVIQCEIDNSVWRWKEEFEQYCQQGQRDQKYINELDKISNKSMNTLALRKCAYCYSAFSKAHLERAKCKQCGGQYHYGCMHCDCQSQSISFKRVTQFDLESSYQTLLISPQPVLKRRRQQGISIFKIQCRQRADFEEGIIKEALQSRDQFVYYPAAMIHRTFLAQIDLRFDPFVIEANYDLTRSYRHYADGTYKAPLKLKIHGVNNFGIQAFQSIPALTLLGEYSADIVPSRIFPKLKWKNQVMNYYQGATSKADLVLAPINICNFGPLLNHSVQGNCASLRIVIDGSIRVLLYTKKKIRAGEELLYNYNGFNNDYPTEEFTQL